LGNSAIDAGYSACEGLAARVLPEQLPLLAGLAADAHLEIALAAGPDGLDRPELLVAVLDLNGLAGAAGAHLTPDLDLGAAARDPDRQGGGPHGRTRLSPADAPPE